MTLMEALSLAAGLIIGLAVFAAGTGLAFFVLAKAADWSFEKGPATGIAIYAAVGAGFFAPVWVGSGIAGLMILMSFAQ